MLNYTLDRNTMSRINLEDPHLSYYNNQLRTGVSAVYSGTSYQNGYGIGNFFRRIVSMCHTGPVTKEFHLTSCLWYTDTHGKMDDNSWR